MLSTYASSMLLLGIASLIIVAYGWHVSGPALVTQSDASSRRQEFVDSLVLKSLLAVPVSAAVGVGELVLRRVSWPSSCSGPRPCPGFSASH